jgi:hypothetical protein
MNDYFGKEMELLLIYTTIFIDVIYSKKNYFQNGNYF